VLGSRRHSAPWGLFGGSGGSRLDVRYDPRAEQPARGAGMLRDGEWLEVVTPGAGGYGDPHERDPASIQRDLDEGRISAAVAAEIYRRLR